MCVAPQRTVLAARFCALSLPLILCIGILDAHAQDAGLRGEYYNSRNFSGEPIERIDPEIDFPFGNDAPMEDIGRDNFSIRWTGFLTPTYTETFTLYTRSDDGVRLYLDGRLLLSAWVEQGATYYSGTASLVEGRRYPIVIEYFERGGGALMQFEWESDSQVREIVPSSALSPDRPSFPARAQVLLRVFDTRAIEASLDDASFSVFRWGDLSEPLMVNLGLGGDAEPGLDFTEFETMVEIEANRSAVDIDVAAFDNTTYRGDKQLEIEVLPGDGYEPGEESSGVITIIDDEPAPAPPSYTLTGELRYAGTRPGFFIVAAYEDADLNTEARRVAASEPGIYALSGLLEGDFHVIAWLDEDEDGELDAGELRGQAEGEEVAMISVPPDRLDLHFDFPDPDAPSPTPGPAATNAPTPNATPDGSGNATPDPSGGNGGNNSSGGGGGCRTAPSVPSQAPHCAVLFALALLGALRRRRR